MKSFLKATPCLAILVASLTAIAPAWGQELIIEEIIVTASKRPQTLQEIPIAVTVVDADVIEKAQILDIKDLQSLVPSLRINQLQVAGNVSFFIRGFGNGSNNIGIEPSVGVFIDGVYRSRTSSSIADFPNLERIEVLRGPQSTLFGKNASAGVISVVTKKPDLDGYSGSASLTVGDYSQVIVKGDITGPLSESLAFSLSGSSNSRDGYFTNLADGSSINESDRYGLRGQLLFQPGDNLEMRLIVDYDELDEFCCGTVNIQDGPTSQIIGLLGGQVLIEDPFARSQYYNYNPTNEIENNGVSLQIDYDIGELTLTSITSKRSQDRFQDSDSDFTSADLLDRVSQDIEIDTFTQELRLASSGDGALDWMIGGYYYDDDLTADNVLSFGQDFRGFIDFATGGVPPLGIPSGIDTVEALFGIPPGTFQAQGQGFVESFAQDNQSFSIFGQVDIHLGDRTTLTLGANYTEDEKDVSMNILSTAAFSALDFEQIVYAQTFTAITTLPPTPANIAMFPAADLAANAISMTDCDPAQPAMPCNPLLPLQPVQFLPPFLNFPNAVESGKTKDDETTWSARLAFDWTDSINVYVGASTGFKATSWNLTRDSRPFEADLAALGAGPNDRFGPPNLVSGTRFAGPEKATAYEIGLKSRFDRGTINIAIFDQEIEGFQSSIFIGTGFVLSNAGKQSTSGVELEANFSPIEALSFTFAGSWMDPKFDSFVGAPGPNGPTDLSGSKVAGVSEFAMTVSGIWSFDFGNSASGFVRAEYVFEDEVQAVDNIPAPPLLREVSTINASAGVAWDNGFEVLLWGRNINDDDYLVTGFPTTVQADRISAYPSQPRTYGVTLTKHFN